MKKLEKFLGTKEYEHWQLKDQEKAIACLDCKFASFSITNEIGTLSGKIHQTKRQLICECKAKFNAIKLNRIEYVDEKIDPDDFMETRKIKIYDFKDDVKIIAKCMEFQRNEEPELDLD